MMPDLDILKHSFVRHFGRTTREVIIHRRIDGACQLLLYEEQNVKDVVYAVGFAYENYARSLSRSRNYGNQFLGELTAYG
jgi:AraC-like DNA-binding protein